MLNIPVVPGYANVLITYHKMLPNFRELIREEHIDRFDEIVRDQLESNRFKKLSKS